MAMCDYLPLVLCLHVLFSMSFTFPLCPSTQFASCAGNVDIRAVTITTDDDRVSDDASLLVHVIVAVVATR